MSRKRRAKVRNIAPDYKFGSTVITKLINCIMKEGKKGKAEKIVYNALEAFSKKESVPVREGFDKIISNLSPLVEVRSRRVGGATYQVPIEVRPERRIMLALRWLIAAARNTSGIGAELSLAQQLSEVYHGKGSAMKKREDTHKMAESNKAFSHYQW